MYSSDQHIGMHINIASHLIRRQADALSMPLGLSGVQTRTLHYLEQAEKNDTPVFQRDIEKHFGIRRASVTSVISNLEQGGYVQRTTVSGDARLKQIILTDSGREVNCRMAQNIESLEAKLSNLFTIEQRDALLDMLHKIIFALDDPGKTI